MGQLPQRRGDIGVHVAMVSDDTALQTMVSAILHGKRIRVEACTVGWQARHHIRRTQPKVVILDMEMPNVKGIRLFYGLRADPLTCDIQVIFLTANPEKVHYEMPNYTEMNVVVVPKPFDPEKLVATVTAALGV